MPRITTILVMGWLALVVIACQGNSPSAALQANAGSDFSIKVGESPSFDGCTSTGDMINFRWKIISAPATKAGDAGKMIREVDEACSFTLPASMGPDEVGEWVIELEVQDSSGNSSTDTVTVTVVQ